MPLLKELLGSVGIELALTLAALLFGFLTRKYHKKFKEIKEFIHILDKSIEDEKLTKKEIIELVKELTDIVS